MNGNGNGQEIGTRAVADTRSSSTAAEWIRARWQQWLELGRAIPELMHRAAVARGASTDPETRETARQSIERLGSLSHMHAMVTDRARSIANLIPNATLGALPIVWPAAVVALALSIAWVINHYDAELRVVQMLEAGRLTPAEARGLLEQIEGGPSFPFSIGAVVKALPLVGLLGFAAWLAWSRPARAR